MRLSGFKIIVIFFLSTVMYKPVFSQGPMAPGEYTSSNKKAIRYIKEARQAFELKNDVLAEKNFKKALDEDKNFIEAALGLANLYQVTSRHPEAIQYFNEAIRINPKFWPNSFYFLSQSYLATGDYAQAKTSLQTFLKFERINPDTRDNGPTFAGQCRVRNRSR
jgi:tetratricopeptide (TPR) repeat protein